MTQLTEHFSLKELGHPERMIDRAKKCADALEIIRKAAGNFPIEITSGYRSPSHNKAVGGSKTSDHTTGWAWDMRCREHMAGFLALIARTALDQHGWDQIIIYPSHVHVSIAPKGRRQYFVMSSL